MLFGNIFQIDCLFVNHPLSRSSNQSLFRFRFRVPNLEINSLFDCNTHLDDCFAGVMAGAVVFYKVSLHVKHNFRQIKDSMKPNLKSRNLVLLMDAIREHNHYSELTLECNKFFKYVLAIVYFVFTPIVNLIVYYSLSEVNPYLRTF
jgi:hypothetical protein